MRGWTTPQNPTHHVFEGYIPHLNTKKHKIMDKKLEFTVISSNPNQGNKVQINPQDWTIKEYPYALPDTGEIVNLKWLHLKNEGF